MNSALPPDTQAILLLCASFGQSRQREPQPLTLGEYNQLARWLRDRQLTPQSLFDAAVRDQLKVDPPRKPQPERIDALIERGALLALKVEQWTQQGLWVLSRSDDEYPQQLKQHLKQKAPPLLYGVGERSLLQSGGLAIVGSRDVTPAGMEYAQYVAQTCAEQAIAVISGGARGIDRNAMLAALDAGGTVIGILASDLAKLAVARQYRSAIQAAQLVLISPYDPHAGFSVGNAMGRNKSIYALAGQALVVSTAYQQGGTWAGATEALKAMPEVPVWVCVEGDVPPGNRELIVAGARPFPPSPWNQALRELLAAVPDDRPSDTMVTAAPTAPEPLESLQPNCQDVYTAVLPLLLRALQEPQDARSLAQCLDVRLGQVQDWLNRALQEGKIQKNQKPVRYQVKGEPDLLLLLSTSADERKS